MNVNEEWLYAKFNKTIKNPDGEDFIEGKCYQVLGENDHHFFVQSRKDTNQVAQFDHDNVGDLFVFTDKYGYEI